MTITVRYFASLREALGADETVEWQPGMTVASLRMLLTARDSERAFRLGHDRALRVAVDQTMADEATVIGRGAEVAFFPPVTGG